MSPGACGSRPRRRSPRSSPSRSTRRAPSCAGSTIIGSMRCGSWCSCSACGDRRSAGPTGPTSISTARPARASRAATGGLLIAGAAHEDPALTSGRRRCRRSASTSLTEHRERQGKERADARRGWVDTPYVFTSSVGAPLEPRALTRTFHALCERHGMRRVRLHDIRYSCVSLLLALGVSPRIVMEIVGHSASEMTMTSTRTCLWTTSAPRSTCSTPSSSTMGETMNDPRCCQ